MTLQDAVDRYLQQIKRSKSVHTAAAYEQGLRAFITCLRTSDLKLDFATAEVNTLSPLWIETFLNQLQHQTVATERLYTTAVAGFYRYVAAQEWATLNLSTLDFEMSQRRSQGKRLHIFPEDSIEALLAYIQQQAATDPPPHLTERLTLYRDTVLLITLADIGLCVSEACGLRRGDLDWKRQRAVEALGEEARGAITPHTFRHYFVTRAARHHDILLAQHLARHESINTTSGYTHLTETEIDQAYADVFNHRENVL